MPDTIVVTGSRYGSNTLNAVGFDFDFFSGSFGAFYIAFGSTTIGAAAGSGTRNFDIPVQDGRPHTTMHGLNATEAAQVLQALDNADRDPALTATFNEMTNRNVTLNISIVSSPPNWFEDSSQIGGTQISVIPNPNGSNGPIQSNSTVEIVIVGGRLDPAGGQDDFRHVLAHELTHLFRDANGNFLDEFHVQDRDGQTFSHLFSVDSSSNILESIDVTPQYSSADYYWHHIGTNGNNFFQDQTGVWDDIVTGAGNDIIVSGSGSDLITIDGGGIKIISDYGYGFDWLYLNTFQNISDIVVTQVLNDLWITNVSSSYAPLADPDAIVLVDYYLYGGNDHIEAVQTASGAYASLMVLTGQDAGGYGYGAYAMAAAGFATRVDVASVEEDATIWYMPDNLPSRYEGVLTYTSHSLADGVDYASLSQNVFLSQGAKGIIDDLDSFSGFESPVSLEGCCLV